MAYVNPFIKLTWGGSVAGEDIWSNSLSLAGNQAVPIQEVFNALDLTAINALIQTAYSGTGGLVPYCTYAYVKAAVIGTDGKTVGEPKIYDRPQAMPGTATFTTPPQSSVAVTLTTDQVRGLAHEGRIFLPAGFGDVAANTGRISALVLSQLLTRFTTFFDGINTYLDTIPGQYSIYIASAVRQGAFRRVTGVRIGNLVDTQRRRRNRLAETYTSGSLSS